MQPNPNDPVAAPADSAGHLGSHTVPSDVEQRRDPQLGSSPQPETNQDRNVRDRPGGRSWLLVIGILALIFLVSWWLGRYAI